MATSCVTFAALPNNRQSRRNRSHTLVIPRGNEINYSHPRLPRSAAPIQYVATAARYGQRRVASASHDSDNADIQDSTKRGVQGSHGTALLMQIRSVRASIISIRPPLKPQSFDTACRAFTAAKSLTAVAPLPPSGSQPVDGRYSPKCLQSCGPTCPFTVSRPTAGSSAPRLKGSGTTAAGSKNTLVGAI